MIATAQLDWQEANKEYLVQAMAPVREAFTGTDPEAESERAAKTLAGLAAEMSAPPTLETLCELFSLSSFERDVLLLCAGKELDSQLAAAVSEATFSLALGRLPNPHWSALAPTGPLRRWRMIELQAGDSLTTSVLRIDERILHFLVGADCLDDRLFGILDPVSLGSGPVRSGLGELPASHREVVARLAAWWTRPEKAGWPVVELGGEDHAAKLVVTAAACAELGASLGRIRAGDIPAAPAERDALAVLLQRESAIGGMAILIDARELEARSAQCVAVEALLESLGSRMAIASRDSLVTIARPLRRIDVDPPTRLEQRSLWHQALAESASDLGDEVERVLAQYRLDAGAIEDAAGVVLANGAEADLWGVCRQRTRGRLEELAQRINPCARWDNLVLPESQLRILRDVAIHMRQRARVYEEWGFAAASDRGLGISTLFAGPSGTGKTMAAEVLANELELDLYRIDLSQVVSKYIGETEKNLRRVFDAAETAGALLLFDEADALFGRRTEVRDSHDRYANIEVSYLLQRMEAYRGVSVLTTNLREAIDKAFLRRIRFIVQFPFPDTASRARIWEGIFPQETPTEGLEWERLAQLNIAGGSIRNIAMNAAFLAADRDGAVGPDDVLLAARHEYAKADKTISDSERRGWA